MTATALLLVTAVGAFAAVVGAVALVAWLGHRGDRQAYDQWSAQHADAEGSGIHTAGAGRDPYWELVERPGRWG